MVWSLKLILKYLKNCTQMDAKVSLVEITQITDVESDQKVKQLLNQLTSILFYLSQYFMGQP